MRHHYSRSLVVSNPEITEVRDLSTGEIRTVWDVVGEDYEKALQTRMAMKQSNEASTPLLACPLCSVPVHMVSMSKERRFYLRHETEDGRCPFRTKGGLSEERILAMKYDGARESAAHKRMKDIIAESLRCDPDFSDVEIERVWKGEEANGRRRPDLRAVWKGTLPVAFEVQLSTTFLRVIAARREFYLREGGLLFWVFNRFDMGNARLTQEDVFYNNNRNAFVANEETLLASKTTGKLVLDCIWSEPSISKGVVTWGQYNRQVSFDELTVERDRQRVFLFDADAARQRCMAELRDWPLREDFRVFWAGMRNRYDDASWLALRKRFAERGMSLPRYPSDSDGLVSLLDTLYSAKAGRPVGWGYADLVKVAHHVFDKHKGHLWAFKLMLAAHGRGPKIVAEDTTGKWRANKVKAYLAAWSQGNPEFAPDRRHDSLVSFLFPEIATDLPKRPS
ncbi:DUF6035 family protein [Dechloromonas agitata]|uniref:DUF6035 family protein n=1 Tax=Dechloromonas agitata TaxID=73030 RepID=UPI00237DA72D|nr:DUF6035 family protein [Dechloromonas agitata]MDE1547132.1 DUF6035 family protein [Dechloromonas agitata]